MIAIDDVHEIDQASAARLVEMIARAPQLRQVIALTALKLEQDSLALGVLRRRCELLTLEPLTQDQVWQLLASLFGPQGQYIRQRAGQTS